MLTDYSKSPFLPYFKDIGQLTVTVRDVFENNSYINCNDIAQNYHKERYITEHHYIRALNGDFVNSVDEAEDIILSKIEIKSTSIMYYAYAGSDDPSYNLLLFVNDACNKIASSNLTLPGNVILIGKKGLDILQSSTLFDRNEKLEIIGRWVFVGLLNKTIKIYLGTHLPEDTIYVVGAFDKPGHANIIEHNSALYLVTLIDYERNYYSKITINQ